MKLEITITGEEQGDLLTALEEVARLVSEDFLSGIDRNATGSFTFHITTEDEQTLD